MVCEGQIKTGTASFARVVTATPSSILKKSKKCTPSFLSSAHTSHTCFGGFCSWIQRQMYTVYSKFWPGSHLELSRSPFGIILRHPFLDPQETCARHWSTVVSSWVTFRGLFRTFSNSKKNKKRFHVDSWKEHNSSSPSCAKWLVYWPSYIGSYIDSAKSPFRSWSLNIQQVILVIWETS